MKICMVLSTPFPPCDGIGYHVFSLSKELMKMGHEVIVLTRGEGGLFSHDWFEGIEIIRAPFLPTYPFHISTHGLWANQKVRSFLEDCDIVHYHTPLVPKLDFRGPTVVTVHSSMIEEINQMETGFFFKKLALQLMTRTFTKFYMNRTLSPTDRIIAVSTSVKNELVRYFGIKDKVEVIYNGVDTSYFKPERGKRRSDYVLYVGRLSYRKGLLELMEAYKLISKETDVDLVLCGKGPLMGTLHDVAVKSGIQDRVHFTGFVSRDELRSLYQGAMVFVAASSYETGPLTALEAMSCGIPVIVTRVGIMPDVIRDGVNGAFVGINDTEELVNKCLEILSDERMAEGIGKCARQTMLDGYQWSSIATQVISVYITVIGEFQPSANRS